MTWTTLLLGAAVATWAAIHSWLATLSMKGRAARRLGNGAARMYRLFYNGFAIVSFAPIALLFRNAPDVVLYRATAPWLHVLLAGQLAAAGLAAIALLQTGPLAFAGIAQALGVTEAAPLATSGFYGIVRHPLYLFGLLFIWLTPIMTINLLVVYIVFTIYFFVGAVLEEKRLVAEFGTTYSDYQRRVPMIIPGLKL